MTHADVSSVIVIGTGRTQRLAEGLAGGRPVEVIPHVGLALRAPPGAPGAPLDAALDSATRPAAPAMRGIKRAFLRAQWAWLMRRLGQRPPALVVCWNGTKGHRMLAMQAARACGHQTLYLEEAPLPGRITADFQGVNAGNSLPRDPRAYRAWAAQAGDLPGWRAIGGEIRARASARADVGQADGAPEGNYIFCPLQVPGDSQITVYGGWIRSIEQLIGALHMASRALPGGWHLRLKEHPSARQAFGARLRQLEDGRFRIDNATDTMAQVAGARAVLTVNSSVGLESFFHDKPVVVLGRAFYALPGLVQAAPDAATLQGLMKDPAALHHDAQARSDFMAYLAAEYFPAEADVIAGRVTADMLAARDARMAAIVAGL